MGKDKRQTFLKRFFKNLTPTKEGCWEWQGTIDAYGYGRIRVHYVEKRAHRISYRLFNGKFDASLCILHACDNRRCVNPEHLFLGSRSENVSDMLKKERQAKGTQHGNARLTPEQVLEIRADPSPHQVICKKFGISQSHVSLIKSRKAWRHL